MSGFDQKMPKGKFKCCEFLTNSENHKNDLIDIFGEYLKRKDAEQKARGMEIVFGGREKVWAVKKGEYEDRGKCNH